FGLLLLSAVFCAFGVLASSMTSGQIVAFILGFVFLFVLFEINKIVFFVPEAIAPVIEFIGIDYHYSNIARGVIDSRDVIYMFSAGGFALYMSVVSLGRRKW
ncbi:MAG: ABC transporter, partial [Candidatus Kapabacteria bacterium]|nr:ABC transporter [Candidatus Kapabacteria bacterium]